MHRRSMINPIIVTFFLFRTMGLHGHYKLRQRQKALINIFKATELPNLHRDTQEKTRVSSILKGHPDYEKRILQTEKKGWAEFSLGSGVPIHLTHHGFGNLNLYNTTQYTTFTCHRKTSFVSCIDTPIRSSFRLEILV